MDRLAILNDALTATEIEDASDQDVRAVYPEFQLGTFITDESLSDHPRLVLLRDEPQPKPAIGQDLRRSPAVKGADGHWHRGWEVIEPDGAKIAAIKAEMEAAVWSRVEDKLRATVLQDRGILTSVLEILQQGPGHAARQRVAQIAPVAADVIRRIRSAATLEEALAIRDEIEEV